MGLFKKNNLKIISVKIDDDTIALSFSNNSDVGCYYIKNINGTPIGYKSQDGISIPADKEFTKKIMEAFANKIIEVS